MVELRNSGLDSRGAELLFQVITAREERASVAIATNHPFSEWGQTFTDPRLAAAVVDRLTFRAHIVETGTESDRLRSSKRQRKGGPGKQAALRRDGCRPGNGGARSGHHRCNKWARWS